MMPISELWDCANETAWRAALSRYWDYVLPRNLEIERSLDQLDHERLRRMDAQSWYDFLENEYFRWKYTAPNRYATTTKKLRTYLDEDALLTLDAIRTRLLKLNPTDTRQGLKTAMEVRGLGTAGASGLLSLMYPSYFATVDQFVVKALRGVKTLMEEAHLSKMNPESLNVHDGVLLIGILRRKSQEMNLSFGSTEWTPRRLDMVLWTYGR